MPAHTPKLLDQVRQALRVKHYAIRTEEAYTHWIKRFILFHHKRHPSEMNTPEIEVFLTYLAVHEQVTASTQNQALAALLFLYRQVLRQELDWTGTQGRRWAFSILDDCHLPALLDRPNRLIRRVTQQL